MAPVRPDQDGMHKGGFFSQRDEEGSWVDVGLYPTDYARNAATDAGHQGLASNQPASCGGVQGAGSELRKGGRAKTQTSGT
jgi:hypothetical protein